MHKTTSIDRDKTIKCRCSKCYSHFCNFPWVTKLIIVGSPVGCNLRLLSTFTDNASKASVLPRLLARELRQQVLHASRLRSKTATRRDVFLSRAPTWPSLPTVAQRTYWRPYCPDTRKFLHWVCTPFLH